MLFVVSIRVRGRQDGLVLHSKRRSPSLCPFTHILRPTFPQIVLGLTKPSIRRLTVGALRRYWRNECFIPSSEGLLLRHPEGLKVAGYPRPTRRLLAIGHDIFSSSTHRFLHYFLWAWINLSAGSVADPDKRSPVTLQTSDAYSVWLCKAR
jgi:hypothetical protein